jgi:hypothetical protein
MEPQTIIARRIARELSTGMLVNLGIGIPTLVANHLPAGMHVFFQSENGLIGTGAPPEEGMAHPTLTDAAGRPSSKLNWENERKSGRGKRCHPFRNSLQVRETTSLKSMSLRGPFEDQRSGDRTHERR